MITFFTTAELAGLAFEEVERRPLPQAYLDARELVWQAEMAKVKTLIPRNSSSVPFPPSGEGSHPLSLSIRERVG